MSCALALADRGHEVVVLEREAEPGGKVRSTRVGEWLVELGPAGILDNEPATQTLLQRLNLSSLVVPSDDGARHRYLLRGTKLREVPVSPTRFITSSIMSLSAKWHVVREPKAPPAPSGVDETIAEFARRRLGDEIAETIVEPMVTGVVAGDYARLSIASVFPKLVELEREHGSVLKGLIAAERARKADGTPRHAMKLTTLKGGMGALTSALGAALGDRLRCGVDVQALERRGDGVVVRTATGPVEADRAVLALPPDDAARVMRQFDAPTADAYAAIPSPGVVAVALGYARSDVTHPLDGFGFLVARKERVRLLGSIWMTSTFPTAEQAPAGSVILRCMLGGTHDPGAVDLSDEELVGVARDGLRTAIGLTIAPRFQHVARWRRGIAQYEVGHATRVALIESRGPALGLYHTGAALRGVGVNDVIRDATLLAERLT